MSIPVDPGSPLPLFVVYSEPRSDLIVRASAYRRVSYSPLFIDLLLPYVAGSLSAYTNLSVNMPSTDYVDVIYDVYDTDGTTLLASAGEVFVSPASGGGGGGDVVYVGGPVAGKVISHSTISGTIIKC
jgi:hypothetical protein